VCAQFNGIELARVALFRACVERAVEGSVLQINRPALSALYSEKTGKKLPSDLMLSANK
jgi:hypothetical protein